MKVYEIRSGDRLLCTLTTTTGYACKQFVIEHRPHEMPARKFAGRDDTARLIRQIRQIEGDGLPMTIRRVS